MLSNIQNDTLKIYWHELVSRFKLELFKYCLVDFKALNVSSIEFSLIQKRQKYSNFDHH